MQVALAVQEGEQQLAAEAVVVAHPRAGDREAEEAVEEDRVLHVAGEREALALELTASPNAVRSQRSSSSEYIQYGLRWRIMNGSKGRSPRMWVRSWIEVPEHVGVPRELGRVEQAGGVGRQVEAEELGGRAGDAAEALGLAVAEDARRSGVGGRSAVEKVSGNRTAHSES